MSDVVDDEYTKTQLAAARAALEQHVPRLFHDADQAQLKDIIDAAWTDAATQSNARAAGRWWDENDVKYVVQRVVEANPALNERTPDVEAVAAHLLAKQLAIHGQDKRGELRLSTYREAAAMSPAERRASGARATQPAAPTVEKPGDKSAGDVPLHARDYGWPGWRDEIERRTGKNYGAMLATERRRLIDEIKSASSRKASATHPSDAARLNELRAKGDKLSPLERINLARLGKL